MTRDGENDLVLEHKTANNGGMTRVGDALEKLTRL